MKACMKSSHDNLDFENFRNLGVMRISWIEKNGARFFSKCVERFKVCRPDASRLGASRASSCTNRRRFQISPASRGVTVTTWRLLSRARTNKPKSNQKRASRISNITSTMNRIISPLVFPFSRKYVAMANSATSQLRFHAELNLQTVETMWTILAFGKIYQTLYFIANQKGQLWFYANWQVFDQILCSDWFKNGEDKK